MLTLTLNHNVSPRAGVSSVTRWGRAKEPWDKPGAHAADDGDLAAAEGWCSFSKNIATMVHKMVSCIWYFTIVIIINAYFNFSFQINLEATLEERQQKLLKRENSIQLIYAELQKSLEIIKKLQKRVKEEHMTVGMINQILHTQMPMG